MGGLILVVAFAYAYEVSGGIADWRYSRAIGYSGTISIPIGKTPEEAVRKFRGHSMQAIHRESVDGGVLLFFQRQERKEEKANLQIEFVRKTWLGWKWVMGGGYGSSGRADSDVAFYYMSMPKLQGIRGPFPIVFGQIADSSVKRIDVAVGGVDAGKQPAHLIEKGADLRLWYAVLPSSAEAPFVIEAYDGEGAKVAGITFNDSRDFASVIINE